MAFLAENHRFFGGLLAETGLSVGRVGELAGFSNLAQFNAAFRQRIGLPPAEFRLREQK